MTSVLVLGGTGFVGRSVCERLVRASGGAGRRIVVPTRRLQHGSGLRSLPTVELVQADVHDDAQLAKLLTGCPVVVNLIAILQGSEAAFARAHVDLPRRLAAQSVRAGGRRLVHVSALGVGPAAPSHYLRSKTAGEAVLQASGLPLTLLRPSVLFGADDRFLNTFAQLQALAPVVPLACADALFQPAWVEDVAEAIVRCVERRDTVGAIYECAGPQVLSLRQLVRAAGRWSGHSRPVIGLPGPLARLQATAMEWLPGEPLLSRDNLASMSIPNVASGQLPGFEALGITPASLEQVAPDYLGHRDGRARLDALRALGRRD